MRCPRCQAELSDSATICNECGSANHQSPTLAFSYLPAGAPAWPTTVPPKPFAKAPVAVSDSPVDGSATKQQRSTRGLLTTLGLLILTPLLGSLLTFLVVSAHSSTATKPGDTKAIATSIAQPVPTTQAQALPVPSSFKDITNSDVNVTFQYPADWLVETPQKTPNYALLAIHPQQQLGIVLTITHYTTTGSAQIQSLDEINQAQIMNFSDPQNGLSNPQVIASSIKQQTIGGTTWSQMEGSFDQTGNIKHHVLAAAIQHGNMYYSLVFTAPEALYQEATDKYLKHITDTFKFLA